MSDLNKVFLLGNLTRDPELRYTPGGMAVCNLGLAVNREWSDKEKQKQKETTFLTVVVWGKAGEACGTHLKKGRPVLVEGRLQSRSWEKDGQKRSTIEVVADSVKFLGGRDEARGGDKQRGGHPDFVPPPEGDDDGPDF